MASARLRVAAGAGLIAASWTVVGPGAALGAAAPGGSDRGHSKADKDSGRGHDGNRGDGNRGPAAKGRHGGDNDQHRRSGGSKDDRDGRGGKDRGGKSSVGAGRGAVGTDDTDDSADNAGTGSDGVQVGSLAVSRAAVSPSSSLVAQQAPQAVTVEVPEVAAGGGSGGAAPPAFVAPSVTFGDGRTPGFHGLLGGAALPNVVADSVAAPATALPALDPSAIEQWAAGPAMMPPTTILQEFASQPPEFIDHMWAPLRPAFPGGLVFGIAGLVIAPLAGVWLGYRQARATQVADQLADR